MVITPLMKYCSKKRHIKQRVNLGKKNIWDFFDQNSIMHCYNLNQGQFSNHIETS